jgi:hypothetical protein
VAWEDFAEDPDAWKPDPDEDGDEWKR